MSKPLVFYRTGSVIRITPNIRRGVFWVDGALTLSDAPKGMPEKGVPKYNWEEKVLIALSPEEGLALSECAYRILFKSEGKVEFNHDPAKAGRGGEKKKLTLSFSLQKVQKKDQQVLEEKYFLNLSQGDAQVAVVLSRADLFGIAILIPQAVYAMLDWAGILSPHDEAPDIRSEAPEPGYFDGDEVPF